MMKDSTAGNTDFMVTLADPTGPVPARSGEP
jgi:hypothetical protein